MGNPANTNALVLAANAKNIDPKNITAMTRLDSNRAVGMLAERTGVENSQIDKVFPCPAFLFLPPILFLSLCDLLLIAAFLFPLVSPRVIFISGDHLGQPLPHDGC